MQVELLSEVFCEVEGASQIGHGFVQLGIAANRVLQDALPLLTRLRERHFLLAF